MQKRKCNGKGGKGRKLHKKCKTNSGVAVAEQDGGKQTKHNWLNMEITF
jgi:hypothetical protein